MMAADSLHVVVPLIVPSGMSFQWLPPCRRACSAGAFAPHFALPSAQPSNVQASCLERARPAAFMASVRAFAGALAAPAAAPPGRRCPERQRRAKAEGKTKDTAPGRVESQSAHGERSTGRLRRRAAWGARPAPMQACPRASRDRTRRSAAMTDRRDDDFRVRPSAPTNRGKGQGQSFVSKVLKQAGKASGGKSAVRRPGTGVNGQRAGQRPGSRLGRGHTVARSRVRS